MTFQTKDSITVNGTLVVNSSGQVVTALAVNSATASTITSTAGDNFLVISSSARPAAGTQTWKFWTNNNLGGPNSWLEFPDGTHQLTAYSGSADTLTTARNINGVSFNGSADITVTAAAGTLTGTTLNSTVVSSSLTSVGTLSSLTVSGTVTVGTTVTTSAASTGTVNLFNTGLGSGTLNIGGAASIVNLGTSAGAITLGKTTSSQLTINSPTIVTGLSTGTLALFDSGFTGTLNFGTVATNVYIGNSSTLIGLGATTIGATNATTINLGASTGNTNVNNFLNVSYTGAGSTSSVNILGQNSKGGATYHDFLKVTNGYASATTPTKWFRLDGTGQLQIINSGYTAQLMTLSDAGDMVVLGSITSSGNKSGYSSGRPGFRVYGSTGSNWGTGTNTSGYLNSSQYTVDFNQGSYLNTTTGVFTAPVDGLYQINVSGRYAGNGNYSQIAAVKNATSGNGSGGSVAVMVEWAGNSTMNHVGAGSVIKLAANDTLVLKVLAGTVQFDSNDNWSVAYIG